MYVNVNFIEPCSKKQMNKYFYKKYSLLICFENTVKAQGINFIYKLFYKDQLKKNFSERIFLNGSEIDLFEPFWLLDKQFDSIPYYLN